MGKRKPPLEYQKFRVRGHIKSFRDLEIYQATTRLCLEIYLIRLAPKSKNKRLLEEELAILRRLSKQVPRLVAEAYGDKFVSQNVAFGKLEEAMRYVSNLIAKLDFLAASVGNETARQAFLDLIRKYQVQRRKILNLKRAWVRIAEKYGQSSS